MLDRISDIMSCQELFLGGYCPESKAAKEAKKMDEEDEESGKQSATNKGIQGQFFNKKFFKLNQAIMGVIDNFSLVNYQQLNIQDEESVSVVMAAIDNLVQYDDYRMPQDSKFLDN